MRGMRLYIKYMSILFKSQMQYRTSFVLLCIGQFFIPFTVFAGMYFLFERFGELRGWTFHETALCYGVIHMSFSVAECFVRGFDSFSRLIVAGEFDRLLVRPRGTVVQVLGSNFEFTRFGRMLQSAVVLGIAVTGLSVHWTPAKIMTLMLMIVGGVIVFSGIFILAAAFCFWTVQGVEVGNLFTNGGREMAQYPMNIYAKWVTRFFTFIIPFGAVSYLPLLYILDRTDGPDLLYMTMPLASLLFLAPCLLAWRIGVRHYRSTGS